MITATSTHFGLLKIRPKFLRRIFIKQLYNKVFDLLINIQLAGVDYKPPGAIHTDQLRRHTCESCWTVFNLGTINFIIWKFNIVLEKSMIIMCYFSRHMYVLGLCMHQEITKQVRVIYVFGRRFRHWNIYHFRLWPPTRSPENLICKRKSRPLLVSSYV